MAEPSVEDDATSTKESSVAAAADVSSGNATKVAAILLAAFMLFVGFTMGFLVASGKEAAETETSSTENTTGATEPVTTTTPPPTTTNQATTTLTTITLPPYYGPKIACYYDLKSLGDLETYTYYGKDICDDIILRMFVTPTGILDTGEDAYWGLTGIADNHIYFMYVWEEVWAESEEKFRELKKSFNNTNRRYSLGWLSTAHLPSVASLQHACGRFWDLSRPQPKRRQDREEQRPTFVINRKDIAEELHKIKWPVPAALPFSAGIYMATENSTGGYCIGFLPTTSGDSLACDTSTEGNIIKTVRGKIFGAENRRSLAELKKQYRNWRNGIVCVLNMECLGFRQNCMARTTTDFKL